jgi:hypothetical protein
VGLNCRESEKNQGVDQNRHPFEPNKKLTEGIGKHDFNAVENPIRFIKHFTLNCLHQRNVGLKQERPRRYLASGTGIKEIFRISGKH